MIYRALLRNAPQHVFLQNRSNAHLRNHSSMQFRANHSNRRHHPTNHLNVRILRRCLCTYRLRRSLHICLIQMFSNIVSQTIEHARKTFGRARGSSSCVSLACFASCPSSTASRLPLAFFWPRLKAAKNCEKSLSCADGAYVVAVPVLERGPLTIEFRLAG